MKDITKDSLIKIIIDRVDYFVPICFNENWNKLYSIDKYRLVEILDNTFWDMRCEKTFINEYVYSIIITFDTKLSAKEIITFTDETEIDKIQFFINKEDITKIKNTIFKDNQDDDFWRNI